MRDEHGHEIDMNRRGEGYCAVVIDSENWCSWPTGHTELGPGFQPHHRARDPRGTGRWIDFDVLTLVEVRRGGGWNTAFVSRPQAASERLSSACKRGWFEHHQQCPRALMSEHRLAAGAYPVAEIGCQCDCHVANLHLELVIAPGTVYVQWEPDGVPAPGGVRGRASDDRARVRAGVECAHQDVIAALERDNAALRRIVREQGEALALLRVELAAARADRV